MDRAAPRSLLRSFERHLRAQNRSERTVGNYLESARLAESFLEGRGKQLQEATRADLEDFLGDILPGRWSPHTAHGTARGRTQTPGGASSDATVARRAGSCRRAACRATGTPHSPPSRRPALPPPPRSWRGRPVLGQDRVLVPPAPIQPSAAGGGNRATPR